MREDRFFYTATFVWDCCGALAFFSVPLLGVQLGASTVELGLMGTLGGLVYTLACPLMGKLADRYDRRRLMSLAGLLTAGLYVLLMGVERVGTLLVIASFLWSGGAMFWPALQAALAEGRSRTELVKTLGTFNLIWTVGFMSGPLFGGLLYARDPYLPFLVAAIGMGLLSVFLFLGRVKPYQPQAVVDEPFFLSRHQSSGTRFRLVAWIASFTTFFTMGIIHNQFPKLATELAISPQLLGRLLALPRLIQWGTFLLIRHTQRWQYRLFPLILPQAVTALSMLVIATMDSTLALGMAFGVLGLLLGTAFSASQFYAFFREERKGKRGATHEMIIGIGNVSGPLLGGILAQLFGLRAPYLLCGSVLVLGMIVEHRLIRSTTNAG